MRQALIVGATPEIYKESPVVRLLPGAWIVHIHGLVDSNVVVNVDGLCFAVWHGACLTLQQAANVSPAFSRRGKERNVSVFVVRQAA